MFIALAIRLTDDLLFALLRKTGEPSSIVFARIFCNERRGGVLSLNESGCGEP